MYLPRLEEVVLNERTEFAIFRVPDVREPFLVHSNDIQRLADTLEKVIVLSRSEKGPRR